MGFRKHFKAGIALVRCRRREGYEYLTCRGGAGMAVMLRVCGVCVCMHERARGRERERDKETARQKEGVLCGLMGFLLRELGSENVLPLSASEA